MFGFGKKKDKHGEPHKKRSKIDKLIMGAIVGGAVGSVIGMSIAPQKGKETREAIANTGKDLLKKGHELADQIQHPDKANGVEQRLFEETPKAAKGLFAKLKNKLIHRQKGKTARAKLNEKDFKKIPHEEIERP